ncbi:MAG: bifunctional folylpolyglutamate synthase/dihydrofolate synthase [Ruminococcus flavefaciens]|nr:bifunctional folylpolyglutamate synthase/dihydrofolate synthase [Ruminococcus flavefaciens]
MNFNECMEFINSYSKSGGKITDLSRAENLMRIIGNPEKELKFVHVAGTNGKGSTVEYISNALIYSGYKTGQFTSPFILRYNDRIRINGNEIDDGSLCEICTIIKENIDDKPYSQFEITMAVAFLWYVSEKCDIVVLECGIGGLLDCTNVIPSPLLSVITSISLDHTDILGDTVEKIAVQKAGIIKESSAVILSLDNKHNVKYLVEKTANEKNAEFITPQNKDFKTCFSAQDNVFTYKEIQYKPAMFGFHQPMNAVTAIETCEYLRKKGFEISDENIKKSIENTQVKARIQYIDGEPPVIVDGGHNPDGVYQLYHALSVMDKTIYAVMGMIDSKDYPECVRYIARCSKVMFTVDGFAPNAVPSEKLAEISRTVGTHTGVYHSLNDAIAKAEEYALLNNGIVVVCGSLYLASEYLNFIGK